MSFLHCPTQPHLQNKQNTPHCVNLLSRPVNIRKLDIVPTYPRCSSISGASFLHYPTQPHLHNKQNTPHFVNLLSPPVNIRKLDIVPTYPRCSSISGVSCLHYPTQPHLHNKQNTPHFVNLLSPPLSPHTHDVDLYRERLFFIARPSHTYTTNKTHPILLTSFLLQETSPNEKRS